MLEDTRRERWNLYEVRDFAGRPQFGVTLDGSSRTVEMFFLNFQGQIERLVFNRRARRVRDTTPGGNNGDYWCWHSGRIQK